MSGQAVKREKIYIWIKLVASVALPLAVGIFTLVATLQNRNIAQQYRDQDKEENDFQRAEDTARAIDEQRETVYVDYINDISRFRYENADNWTYDNLLYIETKTLVALRKVDPYRKRLIFQFLQETEILMIDAFVLRGGDFTRIQLDGSDQILSNAILIHTHFENGSFTNCYILDIILAFSNFNYAQFHYSTVTNINCLDCRFEHTRFDNVLFIDNNFNGANFAYAHFNNIQFFKTSLINVNFTNAILTTTEITPNNSILNSILPDGSFSAIDERNLMNDANNCSANRWKYHSGLIELQTANNFTECWLINKLYNSSLIFTIDIVPYTLLINADRAEFEFSFQFQNNTKHFSAAVHVANGRYGLFLFTQLRKNQHCLNLSCHLQASIPALIDTLFIQVRLIDVNTILNNFIFIIRKRNV